MDILDKLIPLQENEDNNIDIAMVLLTLTMPDPDKPYNIYRYSKYTGFYDFMSALDDLISVVSFELFIDSLESVGVTINDSPGYRVLMDEIYKKAGVKLIEESYEVYDMLRSDIYKIMKSEYNIENEVSVLIRFLQTARHYTNINSTIAKIYDILKEYGDKLIYISKDVYINNSYADMMSHMIADDPDIHNDLMLEYITTDIKDKGLFAFSYYEYIGKISVTRNSIEVDVSSGVRKIFERLLKGEDITDIDELELIK